MSRGKQKQPLSDMLTRYGRVIGEYCRDCQSLIEYRHCKWKCVQAGAGHDRDWEEDWQACGKWTSISEGRVG